MAVNTASTCCTSVWYSILQRTNRVHSSRWYCDRATPPPRYLFPRCHFSVSATTTESKSHRHVLEKRSFHAASDNKENRALRWKVLLFCVRGNVRFEGRIITTSGIIVGIEENNGECSNERRNFIRSPISSQFELIFDIGSEASGYEICWMTMGMTVNDRTVRFNWVEISIRWCWLFSTEEAATHFSSETLASQVCSLSLWNEFLRAKRKKRRKSRLWCCVNITKVKFCSVMLCPIFLFQTW